MSNPLTRRLLAAALVVAATCGVGHRVAATGSEDSSSLQTPERMTSDPAITSTDFTFERPSPATAESLTVAARPRVRAIVGLRTSFTPEGNLGPAERDAQRARIRSLQDGLLGRVAGEIVLRRYVAIPFIALSVDAPGVRSLLDDPGVASLEPDRSAEPALEQTTSVIGVPAARAIAQRGADRVVAVLDSGVQTSHPFLRGRVVDEACFSFASSCPNGQTSQIGAGAGEPCSSVPGCWHGTHVSGIVAGSGSRFSGVAPGARIMSVRVFSRAECPDPQGGDPFPCMQSSFSDVIAGLEHVLDRRSAHPIAAVNMSLGDSTRFTQTCDGASPSTKAAIDNLRSFGIASVVSSGNHSFTDGITLPACISTAVSVGNTNLDDTVEALSNSASFLSLLAPGEVTSSVSSDEDCLPLDGFRVTMDGGLFCKFDGTSGAAPHVAGAWAIVTSVRPTASVATVLDILRSSGVSVRDQRNDVVTPRLDVGRALTCLGDIWINDSSAIERLGVMRFTVTRTRPACARGGSVFAQVTVSTEDRRASVSSATAGADYDARTQTLKLAEGSSAQFDVAIHSDGRGELPEFFVAKVTQLIGARAGDGSALGMILDG